ncbi:MAG: Gfo/Idh/MocA family oxidoreductase [Granulosicoccus sp.]|nr:Gfo/Idh/MocA family oxidoreductase [Granulosicoccus sp.]
MSSKIRCALVGLGRWGELLVEAGKQAESLEITAVVTRTPSKVERYCADNNLQLTDQLNNVLEDDDIDALIIATPHSQHFEQLMKAAECGKHVYCEKPFTLNSAQADEALSALAKSGCKVAIGHNRRFAPNTLALQQLIADGRLGELVHIEGCFHANMAQASGKWRDSVEESPAGGMTSLGIHAVDMLINLMGPITRVDAESERIAATCAFDDHTSARLRFANGGKGQLTTLTSTAMRWVITVCGTKGWAEIRDLDKLTFSPTEGALEENTYPGFDYPGLASITAALQGFAGDVLLNQPYAVSPHQIAHATAVLQAVIDSSLSGESVDL